MKLKTTITGLIMITLSSCEFGVSHDDVPQVVHEAFAARYPNAKDVEWEIEKEGEKLIYEADFTLNGQDMDVEFSPDGTFIREE